MLESGEIIDQAGGIIKIDESKKNSLRINIIKKQDEMYKRMKLEAK